MGGEREGITGKFVHIWSTGNQHSTHGIIITLSNHFDRDISNNYTCSRRDFGFLSCPA